MQKFWIPMTGLGSLLLFTSALLSVAMSTDFDHFKVELVGVQRNPSQATVRSANKSVIFKLN